MIDLPLLMVCAGARQDRAARALDGINTAMDLYAINTPARIGMFLANVGHECGGFQWPEELWGPTPAQKRYEPPGRKAIDLGNTQAGDGKRFKGRGWLQTTGRANYGRLTQRLRSYHPELNAPDFEEMPALLGMPEWAAISAADYVDMRGLNDVADAGDFDRYCDLINLGHATQSEGDSNGYEQRLALWTAAQRALR